MGKFLIFKSVISNFLIGRSADLTYISEGAHWIIRAIGESLTRTLNDKELLKARISLTHLGVRTPLAHFGSIHAFLTPRRTNIIGGSVKTIVTWFHIEPNDPKVARLVREQNSVARIHTACSSTKNQLIAAGVAPEKIIQIPLGIDLTVFEPKTNSSSVELRKQLGIPADAFVIGSFQKDGIGWGDGDEPKLIKGPDIFIKVVAELAKRNKIHVLLTGPGRGYIKKGLSEAGVPFTHIPYIEDGSAVAPYYHALDMYLVSSRIEGGPMAILEAWASGVPITATKVGMIPDIAIDGENALLSNVEDINSLVVSAQKLIDDRQLRERIVVGGLTEVVKYDWSVIANRYYEDLYKF